MSSMPPWPTHKLPTSGPAITTHFIKKAQAPSINASNMGGEFHGIHDIVIRVLVVADLVWLLGWQPQRVEKGRTDRSSRNKHTDIIQSPPVLSYLQFHVASVQVSNEINDLDCHLYIVGPTPWHRT